MRKMVLCYCYYARSLSIEQVDVGVVSIRKSIQNAYSLISSHVNR